MLAVLLKDLRLIARDHWLLLASMLVPVAVISVIAAALLSGGGPRLSLVIVDEDGGPVARQFRQVLAEYADLIELPRDEALRQVRDRHLAPAAVVFPAQMSERHRRGRPSEIVLLTDPADPAGIRAAKLLLLLMEKKAAALDDPLAPQLIALAEHNLTGTRLAVTAFEQNLPGFCLMFVLFAVIFGTALGLHDERDRGALARLLVAPIGFTRVVLGGLGARFLLGLLQMVVLLVWSHLVFGVSLGSGPVAFLVLSSAVVLATVATGLLVAVLTRTREQAQPLGLALVVLLSGLGGLWWPPTMAPGWLRAIAPVVYTTWAMQGLNDLVLRDRGLAALGGPLLALGAYSLAAMALGLALYRRRLARA